jgi:hypothetical protein
MAGGRVARHARSVCEAIVSGLIAAFLWTLIVLVLWAARRWLRYFRLGGDYEGRMKGSDTIERTLKIRVRGSRLRVSGRRSADGATFRGDIVMSDDFAKSGRGHYYGRGTRLPGA